MNVELPMCLIDWIDTDDINWHRLTENNSQGAIQLFKNIQKNKLGLVV